jgi:hypothetical protein
MLSTLYSAVFRGDVSYIQRLISQRKDLQKGDLSSCLPIAAKKGHNGLIRILLKAKADVSFNNNEALLRACEVGSTEAVKILIDHKADVTVNNSRCVDLASHHGQVYATKILKMLINAKADINHNDDIALWRTVLAEDNHLVRFLIEHKANVHARNGGMLPAALKYRYPETLKILLENGARISDIDPMLRYYAVCFQRIEMVDILLKHGRVIVPKNPLGLLLECEAAEEKRKKPFTYFLSCTSIGYGYGPGDNNVVPRKRIQELILRGLTTQDIKGLTKEHFRLLYGAILPYIHERLRRHERHTGTELLDMKKIIWHVLSF